jgi:hypothetical protein
MGGDVLMPDILTTFSAAVAAYNKYDWPTLESFLDDHVLLKLPDNTKAPIYGKSNVIHYLAGEALDEPTFTPAPNASHPITPHDVDDLIGFITHIGSWVDKNHKLRPIYYAFTFINHGSPNNPVWKILLLWSNN